jgi:hypothetical protein
MVGTMKNLVNEVLQSAVGSFRVGQGRRLRSSGALGQSATTAVAVADAVADGHVKIVPDVLVGGGDASGAFTGWAATMTGALRTWRSVPALSTGAGSRKYPAMLVRQPHP